MRELFLVFVVLVFVSPALATGESQPVDKTAVVATAAYVDGAYNAVNTSKQDKLTSTNVVESGSGAVVSGVTASNGTVTVVKSEVLIPVDSVQNPSGHIPIWFQ